MALISIIKRSALPEAAVCYKSNNKQERDIPILTVIGLFMKSSQLTTPLASSQVRLEAGSVLIVRTNMTLPGSIGVYY